MHFREIKYSYIYQNFTEDYSESSNCQYVSIGSGDVVVPNLHQVITRIAVDPDVWCHMAPLGHSDLHVPQHMLLL